MKTHKTRISQRKIPPASLPATIDAWPLFVLYVGPPTSVAGALLSHFDSRAGVGWIARHRIDTEAGWSRLWIVAQRASLGWSASFDMPEGYYLFIDARATRHNAGVVDFDHDRASLVLGLGSAAVALAVEPKSTVEALALVHAQAAQRVMDSFDSAIDEHLRDVAQAFAAAAATFRRT